MNKFAPYIEETLQLAGPGNECVVVGIGLILFIIVISILMR